jgi:hypothetical protein
VNRYLHKDFVTDFPINIKNCHPLSLNTHPGSCVTRACSSHHFIRIALHIDCSVRNATEQCIPCFHFSAGTLDLSCSPTQTNTGGLRSGDMGGRSCGPPRPITSTREARSRVHPTWYLQGSTLFKCGFKYLGSRSRVPRRGSRFASPAPFLQNSG